MVHPNSEDSGSEIGPFRAIEESIVAYLTKPDDRAHVYAWYSLGGSLGTALGMLTGGLVITHLIDELGWDKVASYRVIFFIYAALGLVKATLVLMLSQDIELDEKQELGRPRVATSETAPLLHGALEPNSVPEPRKTGLRRMLPDISRESVAVVAELCILFALDSFASGLAPM
jgi:MFS family permease